MIGFAEMQKGELMSDLIDRQAVLTALDGLLDSTVPPQKGANRMSNLVDTYYTTATTLTKADAAIPYINQVKVGNNIGIIRDAVAHDEIAELREMIERLKGKPYYMNIQCHNCGAPLVIESSNHLIKCKYCQTAYFSGTQLVNSGI